MVRCGAPQQMYVRTNDETNLINLFSFTRFACCKIIWFRFPLFPYRAHGKSILPTRTRINM